MTADARVTAWLDRLEGLLRLPERRCDWCAAEPGEWCIRDCGNPERWCEPSHVAADAAERAPSDRAAALITESIAALPALLALARGVTALADYWDAEAKRLRDQATDLRRHRFPDSGRLRDEEATDLEDRATRLRRLLADAAPDTGEDTA